MYDLKSDTDTPLTSFINDYAEGKLNEAEISAFHEFLSYDAELSAFVEKTSKGRNALKNAFKVTAADDFEEKLQCRIRMEIAEDDILNDVTKRYLNMRLSIILRQWKEIQEYTTA